MRPRHVPRAVMTGTPPRAPTDLGQCQREDAHVARPASLRRQAPQRGQQLGVVCLVRRVLAGVSPRPHARAAVERVDLDARIVGQRRQAARPHPEASLDRGVRLERLAVLDRVARDPEVVERHEHAPIQRQQLAQLAQLVHGARRDQQPLRHRRTVARTAACASNRRASPVSARSSSPSAAARSNGLPSAVPCSST